MVKGGRGRAVGLAEQVGPGARVEHALVHMHGRARLIGERLGHEGGVHVVLERGLMQQALEVKQVVGHGQRLAAEKIHADLA
ncbi:hypothetical protein LP419_03275 [Massilia sp. H-1]|nr:hypothetical protein LP419_03275 [Massilia sp. H-1]